MIHQFGSSTILLSKLNAIQHNTLKSEGKTNVVDIYLDDARGSRIHVVFEDYETASNATEKLREAWEEYKS